MHTLSDNVSDVKLLRLLQQGRKDAFEALFKKYYHPLWRHSVKYLHDSHMAEEIVQEFFIYLWENQQTLTLPNSVAVYFHVAIKNRCLNYLKKKIHLMIPIENTTDILGYEPDQLIAEELSEAMDEAINKLPEKCKLIFLLNRQSHFSYKEIAGHLAISIKTVESQMGIALKKLREHLLKHGVRLLIWMPMIKETFF
ncbi:RNA polymerase sigma-70 factor [Rhodocytophaga aerolata]|uniref:RNA polymerase sigma-70 factor n=1 Tax=Rhodocytophaga aerolata TaxID=455078 RepID=A0ABT8RF12_9BACT|nr:RNA polymerase sigma-70 factor [Rhodocytophaga aerolata]MDO1449758.1 RNA polymerase sigma-70 factor [Rhodocytophaga aerolata]